MNEEEKELIKKLENDIEALAFPSNLGLFQGTLLMNIDLEDLKTLLIIISKLEKVIDLMAESWKQDDIRSVEEIKEYFYKKVEEENE